jgi:peptidoglycan/LPS O-acetylase OafA/YrhL
MEKKSSSDNIFGLDFMRTTAILMIMFGHCLSIYPPNQSLIYQIGLFSGFLGVEIFFVLSGFLVGRILYQLYVDNDFSIKKVLEFLKRRSFRILPNYYLVLILNIIISFIVGYAVADWWKYFFFLQNFSSTMLPFFPESWPVSIGVFAFLLLLIALYLKTAIVKPSNKPLFFLLVVLGLTLFFVFTKIYYSFTTQNTTLNQWNLEQKALVIYRLDAFFIGVLAAWISLNRLAFWKKIRLPFAFLGMLLFGFMFVGVGFFQLTIDRFPHFWNIFYLPLISLICLLFLPLLSQWKSTSFTFLHKPITFISLISYSLYLLHYSIILQLLLFYFPKDNFAMNQLHLYSLCYFLITFLLATLLYKFFENPLRKLSDK